MAAISDNLKDGGSSLLCGDNAQAEKLVRRVTVLSSWKRQFVCVSHTEFVAGVPTGELSDDEYALLCDTVSAFAKRSEGSVFLADFEGESEWGKARGGGDGGRGGGGRGSRAPRNN